MRRNALIYGALLAALSLAGCRKELCYDHAEHALAVRVNVEAEWEQEWERTHETDWESEWEKEEWDWLEMEYDELRPEAGSGIVAKVYHGDVVEPNYTLGDAGGGILPLAEGVNTVLFYNVGTEYNVLNLEEGVASATATTRSRSRANFEMLHEGERTVNAPDMLYGAYVDEYVGERSADTATMAVTMRPLVYTYVVCYRFTHGLEYVALARGALAGMAESVYLTAGHTGDETATILYDECEVTDWGVATVVNSFGVPNYHPADGYNDAAADDTFMLSLEVMLKNGETVTREWDVTEQVRRQPRGGVIVVDDMEVDDETGLKGGGSFDVSLEGWGDYVDVPLPLE